MSLLLTVFLMAFVTQLISWIGKKVLFEWTYNAYLRLTRNPLATRQRALKTEILNNKSELLKTSAQDQFAKWAKLRRTVDKGLAELEKLNSEIAARKSGFSTKFNALIWVLTSGVTFVIGWWYGRKPVFYLPEGWMGPLTWWFSFPFAPRGSVSVGVWSFACKRIFLVLERAGKAIYLDYSTPHSADAEESESKVEEVPLETQGSKSESTTTAKPDFREKLRQRSSQRRAMVVEEVDE
ncbi:hypothetical protein FA15DRAFT_97066 [Coprinopsis marcescibilis]|uniref:Uncharacterized protein n=1 Tax=Coprinopsis marcescibilis TaxID=230819 RepID=A0A5C3KM76_COPMA|nr:hypothetical protein FA15DRAFT_97066 [Coprinopsis marcescibilis]